jgi:hypothetical protein
MEHRRVKIHDHLYQWVDAEMWEARVVGSATPGRLFDTFEEALSWVQRKPHFMLIKVECVKAYKIRSPVQVSETAVVDAGQQPQEQDHPHDHVDDGLHDLGNAGNPGDPP